MKVGKFLIKLLIWTVDKEEKKRYPSFVRENSETELYDIRYGGTDDQRCFDLFKCPGSNVLLIEIHGGAYLHGNRFANQNVCRYFVGKGFSCVAADYRLIGPGQEVEDQIKDLLSMLEYLKSHEEELGIASIPNWAITGDSAGGHMALLLAEILSDPALRKEWGVSDEIPQPKSVLINCPVYDLKASRDAMKKSGSRYMFGPSIFDEDVRKKLDPREHISSLKAPLFVSSNKNDFLKWNSLTCDEDCKALGLKEELLFIESDDKVVGHSHNVIVLDHPESIKVNDRMAEFIKENL